MELPSYKGDINLKEISGCPTVKFVGLVAAASMSRTAQGVLSNAGLCMAEHKGVGRWLIHEKHDSGVQ